MINLHRQPSFSKITVDQKKDEEMGHLNKTTSTSKQSLPPQQNIKTQALIIENLTIFKKSNSHHIIKNANVEANFGEITAIMGPSGSGKTSLLRYVANIYSHNLIYKGKKSMVGNFKFVAQEEHLHGFFTIDQYLDSHYGLNYGFVLNKDFNQKVQLKNNILSNLQLLKAQNTRVGDIFIHGLSGGEKRRLSVALELISKPTLLILDEPTSGLDSFAAEKVMEALSNLVKKEKIALILTIHQPSSRIFKMIDSLILLKEGEIMYQGPTEQVSLFFARQGQIEKEHYNPADQCLEILCMEETVQKCDFLLSMNIDEFEKRKNENNDNISQYFLKANNFEKFCFLTHRNFKNFIMNPAILVVRIVMYIGLCFMVGAMFWDLGSKNNHESVISRTSVLFYVDAFLVFMSIAAVPSFMMERAIVEKELRNKLYHPWVFQLSNWFTSWFGVFFIAIISTLFVVLMCNLNNFGIFLIDLFLSLLIAEGLAFLTALLVPHYIIAMALIAGLYGMFMLCEGFLIVYNDIPPWFIWGYYLGFHSYTFRTFMYNEFNEISEIVGSRFQNGKDVLAFYSMENVVIKDDLVILLGYILGIQILTAVIIKIRY